MSIRRFFPIALATMCLICGCSGPVADNPALWPIEPIEVFIQINDEFGDNLLDDSTVGNWSDTTFKCRFEGLVHQCDRNTVIDQDHVMDEDYFYGITIARILVSETISIPVIGFGAFSGKRQMDDEVVFLWPDGSEDTVHIKNTFYYNDKGYPISKRKYYLNGEECTNWITLIKEPFDEEETGEE